MKVSKVCSVCGKQFNTEPTQKECPECKGVLKRIFNKDANLNLGDIREDEFVKIDRFMLESSSPTGKTRSCI